MEEKWRTVWDHLDELRSTFLHSLYVIGACFFVVIGFHHTILSFLTSHVQMEPYKALFFPLSSMSAFTSNVSLSTPFLILGPLDGLMLIFKVCFWLSVTLTLPLWGWAWVKFILPAMKPKERLFFLPFVGFSIFFSLAGLLFAYYITLPISNTYLASLNSSIGLNAWTLENYINYTFFIYAGHAIAAELGFLLLLCTHLRLLSPEWLVEKRRLMIVVAVIIGAVLTPPDVLTQLLLALPLILLYEVTILYAKWRNRKIDRNENLNLND